MFFYLASNMLADSWLSHLLLIIIGGTFGFILYLISIKKRPVDTLKQPADLSANEPNVSDVPQVSVAALPNDIPDLKKSVLTVLDCTVRKSPKQLRVEVQESLKIEKIDGKGFIEFLHELQNEGLVVKHTSTWYGQWTKASIPKSAD